MKKCNTCGRTLDESRFNRSGSRLQPKCKECKAAWSREKYQKDKSFTRLHNETFKERNRALMVGYLLEHPCVDWGEADPVVLEFDHIRGVKDGDVCVLFGRRSWENLLIEIAKCEVCCANCHRRRTAKRSGHFRTRLAPLVYKRRVLRVTQKCPCCGSNFDSIPSQLRKYCSAGCANKCLKDRPKGGRRHYAMVPYNGQVLRLTDLARQLGVSPGTLRYRLRHGKPLAGNALVLSPGETG